MKRKSIVGGLILASSGVIVLLTLIAALLLSSSNDTWSGWMQAIGSIGAILAGWIVVVWQDEKHEAREEANRSDRAAIVGWRIFTAIVVMQTNLSREIRRLLKLRRTMKQRGAEYVQEPFSRIQILDTIMDPWLEYRHFKADIGQSLVQILSRIETYSHGSAMKHPIALEFVEEQIRALRSMLSGLREIHGNLSRFLEQDRSERLRSYQSE